MRHVIYQPLIINNSTYSVSITKLEPFPAHWHSELEIIYCLSGGFKTRIEHQSYSVSSGDCVFISCTEIHEYYEISPNTRILLIEIGPAFLGADFQKFLECVFSSHIQNISRSKILKNLLSVFSEAFLENSMEVKGLLYFLSSYMLKISDSDKNLSLCRRKRIEAIAGIQAAIDYVAANYNTPISIEQMASLTGYGKSNFCKQFKNATQLSFHKYLNMFRIRNACTLLEYSNMTISAVAESVGIPVEKSFDRIFKQYKHITPGEYRTQMQNQNRG